MEAKKKQNRKRTRLIRERMQATGENYTKAAREIDRLWEEQKRLWEEAKKGDGNE